MFNSDDNIRGSIPKGGTYSERSAHGSSLVHSCRRVSKKNPLRAGAGRWGPRGNPTEAAGTVLGANFMEDHDCFFDAERRRVGFARADCDYHSLK